MLSHAFRTRNFAAICPPVSHHPMFNRCQLSRAKSHRQGTSDTQDQNWWSDRSEPPCVLLSFLCISASICQSVPQLSKASVSINEANNHRLQTACLSATVLSLTFILPRRLRLPAVESSHSAAGHRAEIIIKGCGPIASPQNAIMRLTGIGDQKQVCVSVLNVSHLRKNDDLTLFCAHFREW